MRRAALILVALLGGCSFVPRYQRPAAPVPAAWPSGDAYRANSAGLARVDYRDIFRDARLQRVIERALANSRDLRVAFANIEAARAQLRIQRAQNFPTINTNNTVSFVDPGTGRSNNNGAPVIGGQRTNYALNLGATQFEIDLFGRVAALTLAAKNQYFASEAGARATRLVLVGDVANAWLQYGADKSLLALAERTAKVAEESVRLTRARVDGGVAPRTDLTQAEQTLETARANAANQRTLVAQDVNALQLLVGASVPAEDLPGSIEETLPQLAELPAGLDSSVLLRRPDVVQAEYQLLSANAQIGAARAALFPRLTLTGIAGLASNNLTNLFTTNAFNYTATPGISYPVFAGGAGRAGVAQARAQFDAALAAYEQTIQTAFREVADALARRGTIAEQLRAQEQLTRAAEETFRLSGARYRGGVDTYLTNLDAQRSLYQAQQGLVNTRLIAATNLVALYRTLGGDTLIDATPQGPVPAAGK